MLNDYFYLKYLGARIVLFVHFYAFFCNSLLVCDLYRTPNCYGKTWRFLCPFFRNLHLRENLARDCFTSTVSTVTNSVQNIFTHLRYCDKYTVATFNNNLVWFTGAIYFVVENLRTFNQTSEFSVRPAPAQIAYIGGPPKTRQFFRPHPPADSQRIRWWDAGKMAIGLCHVPLAESAQTASGWASGHWRHAGGFRSRQAGRDGQPALHQRISFEPDGHKRDPPVRRPFITLAVWTIRCFFPWFLFLLTF